MNAEFKFEKFAKEYKSMKNEAHKQYLRIMTSRQKFAKWCFSPVGVATLLSIIIFPILWGAFVISASTMWWVVSVSALIFIIVATILSMITYNETNKKEEELSQYYEQNVVKPLKLLLVEHNLYSLEGIGWLIQKCESKIKKINIAWVSIGVSTIPLIISLVNFILNHSSIDRAVMVATSLAILIVVIFLSAIVLAIYFVVKAIHDRHFPDYKVLKLDLEYIRTRNLDIEDDVDDIATTPEAKAKVNVALITVIERGSKMATNNYLLIMGLLLILIAISPDKPKRKKKNKDE